MVAKALLLEIVMREQGTIGIHGGSHGVCGSATSSAPYRCYATVDNGPGFARESNHRTGEKNWVPLVKVVAG